MRITLEEEAVRNMTGLGEDAASPAVSTSLFRTAQVYTRKDLCDLRLGIPTKVSKVIRLYLYCIPSGLNAARAHLVTTPWTREEAADTIG
jgi:hypothetical protein